MAATREWTRRTRASLRRRSVGRWRGPRRVHQERDWRVPLPSGVPGGQRHGVPERESRAPSRREHRRPEARVLPAVRRACVCLACPARRPAVGIAHEPRHGPRRRGTAAAITSGGELQLAAQPACARVRGSSGCTARSESPCRISAPRRPPGSSRSTSRSSGASVRPADSASTAATPTRQLKGGCGSSTVPTEGTFDSTPMGVRAARFPLVDSRLFAGR